MLQLCGRSLEGHGIILEDKKDSSSWKVEV